MIRYYLLCNYILRQVSVILGMTAMTR